MSAPASPTSPIRVTSAANGNDRQKIAAGFSASIGCSKSSPIPGIRITPKRTNGLAITVLTPSTNCRLESERPLRLGLRTVVTLLVQVLAIETQLLDSAAWKATSAGPFHRHGYLAPAFLCSSQNEERNLSPDKRGGSGSGMRRGKKSTAEKPTARRLREFTRSVRGNLRQAHRILRRAQQATSVCYEKAGMAMLSAKAFSGMSEEQFALWLGSFGLSQDRVRHCIELAKTAHPRREELLRQIGAPTRMTPEELRRAEQWVRQPAPRAE